MKTFKQQISTVILLVPSEDEEGREYQEYQGPAHNTCDLQKRRRTVIPVIFNNLTGFASHLLMQQLHTVEARK